MRMNTAAKVGVGSFVLLAGGAAALTVHDPRLPEPLVTEAELPALPAATDNGWTLIAALPRDLSLDDSDDITIALAGMQSEDASPSERWDALQEAAPALRGPRSRDEALALDAWHRAVAAPTFVDACKPNLEQNCAHFLYFQVHQLALVEVAKHAVDGRWAQADQGLTEALRLDRALLATARGSMGATVSASAVIETLALTHLLAHQDPGLIPGAVAAVDTLEGLLDGLDLHRRAALMAYLYSYARLRSVEENGTSILVGDDDWRPGALYDASHSAALVDSVYLASRETHGPPLVVVDGGTEPAGCSGAPALYNSIGCSAFDPEPTIAMRARTEETIEDYLSTARRWARRVSDLRSAP